MGQCRAVWPAKQHMGNVDGEINIELWRIGYLSIHVILRWSAHCCRTTGVSCSHIGQEECLGETCCHVTVTRTCFLVKPSSCHIDMETHCGGRLGKGIGGSWGDERGFVMKGVVVSHEVVRGELLSCLLL